jgi:hypothetical protein
MSLRSLSHVSLSRRKQGAFRLTRNPRYNARLAARPLLTQSVTTAVLFATGDITAQQLVEKKGIKGHDLTRTGRMALYGGCESPAPDLVHCPFPCAEPAC